MPSDSPEPNIDELVFDCLERMEREGDWETALNELCAAHPEHEEALRDSVRALHETGLIENPADTQGFPEELGEFRLLSRLGEGGMGVVYLAEQTSVGRRVALKLLRPDQLYFGDARARFQREVETVGRLSHPNIATIHTVGEERGIPFCAMEFVDGCSLDRVIASLAGRAPAQLEGEDLRAALGAELGGSEGGTEWDEAFFRGSWVEVALRIVSRVAGALQHAHERGVLHRDVKLSNVMITPEGRVVLLDFGLASLPGTSRITRTGSQVGSVPYMSPEQLEGVLEGLDARTDVYSLGIMLYELLTLALPYFEESGERTRRRILEGRPPDLRAANPAVPVDAETVCLTAMDRDRERRYASAADLARDIDCLLELRPISARPMGPVLRFRRWTQRRPAAALALLFGTVIVVGGPIGFGVQRSWAARQIGAALEREEQEHERAERHYDRAFEAIQFMLREMASKGLEDTPRVQEKRLDIIDLAMELFVDLEAERPGDIVVRRERARLHRSRAEILRDLGRSEESGDDCERCVDLFRELASEPGAPLEDRWDLAVSLHVRAAAIWRKGLHDEGVLGFEETIPEMRAVLAEAPLHAKYRHGLSVALESYATSLRNLGRLDEAELAALEAEALARDLVDDDPASSLFGLALASAQEQRALVASDRDETEDALALRGEAIGLLDELLALDRFDRNARFEIAVYLSNQGALLLRLERFDEARRLLERSMRITEELAFDYPTVSDLESRTCDAMGNLALSYLQAGEIEQGRDLLERSVDIRVVMVERAPERLDFAHKAANALANLANLRINGEGRPEDALDPADRALELVERCIEAVPGSIQYAETVRQALYLRALACCQTNRIEEARAALADFEGRLADDPWALRQAADLWNEWILAVGRTAGDGGVDRAEEGAVRLFEYLNRAVEAGYRDSRELEQTGSLAPFRDDPRFEAVLEAIRVARD